MDHSLAKNRLLPLLMACALAFLPSRATAEADSYEYGYTAGEHPEEATPAWKMISAGDPSVRVADGKLQVGVAGGNRALFVIGTFANGVRGDIAAWDMQSGVATIEFRVRCHSTDPDFHLFRVQFTDGKKSWVVSFTSDTVNRVRLDTSEMDTYRLAAKDGVVQISSERYGLISKAHKPASDTDSQCLIFGTQEISGAPAPRDATGGWELEFIRWTTREANMEPLGPKR